MKHKVRLQQSVHEAQGCSGKVAIGRAESDGCEERVPRRCNRLLAVVLRSNEEPRARESERDEGGCAGVARGSEPGPLMRNCPRLVQLNAGTLRGREGDEDGGQARECARGRGGGRGEKRRM
jgi:hypothetical protein